MTATSPVWEDGNWQPLAPLDRDVETDYCVVGLGGSGLSAMGELLRLGARVVGIDAAQVGGGAAGRNGGFLLAGLAAFYHDAITQFGHDRSRELYRRTLQEMDRIAAEVPEAIRRVGSLRIAADEDEEADCRAQLDALCSDGFPAQWYRGVEGCGILIPGDGAFDPLHRCRVLARRAADQGALLFEGSPAIEIRGDQVRTPGGCITARAVIVAVDGRLPEVFPELSSRVRSARLQMLATAPAREVNFPRPVYRRYGYDYWQQLPDGRIALGGLRDTTFETEWTADASVSDGVQQGLEAMLRDVLRVTAPVTHRWSGTVAYSRTGLPIVTEVRPRVWAIGGYNGTGNVLGAICGRGVAEQVITGSSNLLDGLLT